MNDQDKVIEGAFNDPETQNNETGQDHDKKKSGSDPVKSAWKQVENIGQTLGEALQGRGNVVMVRVNDETLEHLDMLVEAELVKSRSEAAALLINEGIKSNDSLFVRIREITDKIAVLRSQLRDTVEKESQSNSSNL